MKRFYAAFVPKKYLLLLPTLILLLLITYVGQAQEKANRQQVALSPIKPSGSSVTGEEANIIADRFRSELFSTGQVVIMERTEMDEILKEQGFQQSGACNDERCLVQMGQLLGVNKIISGSIGRLGSLLILNFRLIDVETGKIERAVSRDIGGGIEDVVKVMPSMAYEIVGLEIPKEKQYIPPSPVVEKTPEPQSPNMSESGKGVLAIDIYPEKAILVIDGKEYGSGHKTIELPVGTYRVSGKLKQESSEGQTVRIYANEKSSIKIRLERKTRFTLSTKFTGAFGDASDGFGPSLEFGLKKGNHLFALNYYWGFYEFMFGGAFHYGYIFNIHNFLMISPGVSAGFWYEEHYNYNHDYSYGDYDKYMYFGCPSIRIQVGYKYAFLNLEVNYLIGTSSKLMFNPGISVYF